MLKALLTFAVMVATTCAVFAAVGILSWQMALAVLVGSAIGSVLSKVRLSRDAGRPAAARSSSAQ